ncbi:MAG: hypothetical protein SynsKO_01370 [Synoicihabitans sp.]
MTFPISCNSIKIRRTIAIALVSALSVSAQTDNDTPTETADERVARLLAAVGGKSAWSRVNIVIIEATHFNLTAPASYDNRIVNDLTQPRVRFEGHAPGWDRWATIDGNTGTYRRDNEPVTKRAADRVAADNAWWSANIYRTLRRLARNDPALTAKAIDNDRLEIHEDGELLNWFRLDENGAPVLYGTDEESTGTIFGPLRSHPSGIRYPEWGAGENGAFRYRVEKFTVNPLVGGDAFEIPEPSN